jgi:hypothetical protein
MKTPKRKTVTKDDRRRAWALGIARKEANQVAADRLVENSVRDLIVASLVSYQVTQSRDALIVGVSVAELQAVLRQLDRARLSISRLA